MKHLPAQRAWPSKRRAKPKGFEPFLPALFRPLLRREPFLVGYSGPVCQPIHLGTVPSRFRERRERLDNWLNRGGLPGGRTQNFLVKSQILCQLS